MFIEVGVVDLIKGIVMSIIMGIAMSVALGNLVKAIQDGNLIEAFLLSIGFEVAIASYIGMWSLVFANQFLRDGSPTYLGEKIYDDPAISCGEIALAIVSLIIVMGSDYISNFIYKDSEQRIRLKYIIDAISLILCVFAYFKWWKKSKTNKYIFISQILSITCTVEEIVVKSAVGINIGIIGAHISSDTGVIN